MQSDIFKNSFIITTYKKSAHCILVDNYSYYHLYNFATFFQLAPIVLSLDSINSNHVCQTKFKRNRHSTTFTTPHYFRAARSIYRSYDQSKHTSCIYSWHKGIKNTQVPPNSSVLCCLLQFLSCIKIIGVKIDIKLWTTGFSWF